MYIRILKLVGCDSKNVQMLYGSIIHCVFQQVLQKKLVEEDKILLEAEQVVKQSKYLHEIFLGEDEQKLVSDSIKQTTFICLSSRYANNTTEGEVMEEIKKYIPPLLKWLEQYTNITQNLLCAQKTKTSDIAITKVKDIEENIWSPRMIFKQKKIQTLTWSRLVESTEFAFAESHKLLVLKNKNKQTERGTVPLELKTGRPTFSMEHKGQVSLYSMMSSDRREDPKKGLLLYLKEPDMKLIPVDHVNKRGLIQLRNEMAYYLSRKMSKVDSKGHVTYSFGKLPEPINNQRACVKCPQLLNCALYQKNMEHRSVHSGHAMSTLVPNSLSHILPSHMEYYTHWNLMLDLEMQSDVKKGHLKDIWCKTGIQRQLQTQEDVGDCISGLVLSTDNKDNSVFDSGVSIVKFCRHQQHPSSLNLIGLSVDDYIIVSTENSNHIGLCTGVVRNITDSTVELITERESIPRLYELKSPIFRLDRCSSYNTASIFYSNLSSTRLRELLIDKRKPEFVIKLSKSEIEKVKVIFKPLNKPQKTAILKVLMSTDYVLIKGYPGTGKTSTIVALVKVLKELGYSVLLTSYTHSAVDNILLKLKKDDVKFLRLGKISKIHPGIHEFAAENLTKKFTHVADLRQFYSEQIRTEGNVKPLKNI
ncbi:hypothetical protein KUTeg_010665 [Tegillarca granosa]|uniref:DNA helicase n=1 Tax=Tegillarca granosa TaxID=220873 RepID=A0ABQ9F302_TEGGR|nr:hypothetical protein KUTeg_010665 [Tegillarca granosa]